MSLHPSQFGDATRRPTHSALSGKPLDFGAGDVAITLNGYSLGVKAREWRSATPEQQAAALAEWTDALPKRAAKEATPLTPVYADLSFEDLKALAETRGVDISGRRSKDAVIQALNFADLQARSTPSLALSETAPEPAGLIGE